jgi:hypothetical protein
MATSYNAQMCRKENKYSIQFETSSYELFKMVEKACQKAVDKNQEAVDKERCSRMRTMGHL